MIRITSIKRCHIQDYDKIYLIVRSISSLEKSGSSILRNAEHVPDLSPSSELFFQYLNWQRTGCWDKNTFETAYKPIFEQELSENKTNVDNWLDKIKTEDANGKRIALLCFCADENLCHRIIIGNLLENMGCNVIFDRDTKRGIN